MKLSDLKHRLYLTLLIIPVLNISLATLFLMGFPIKFMPDFPDPYLYVIALLFSGIAPLYLSWGIYKEKPWMFERTISYQVILLFVSITPIIYFMSGRNVGIELTITSFITTIASISGMYFLYQIWKNKKG